MIDKGWYTYYDPPEVIPIDDTKEHIVGMGCECRPCLVKEVIVHNSYDMREFIRPNELAAQDRSVRNGKSTIQ